MSLSKAYKASSAKVDRSALYTPAEAIKLAKETIRALSDGDLKPVVGGAAEPETRSQCA